MNCQSDTPTAPTAKSPSLPDNRPKGTPKAESARRKRFHAKCASAANGDLCHITELLHLATTAIEDFIGTHGTRCKCVYCDYHRNDSIERLNFIISDLRGISWATKLGDSLLSSYFTPPSFMPDFDEGDMPDAPPNVHTGDFRMVRWDGVTHTFTAIQALVVSFHWNAAEQGMQDVSESVMRTLLTSVGSEKTRVQDVLKGHAALGSMIVPGAGQGSYRLATKPMRA